MARFSSVLLLAGLTTTFLLMTLGATQARTPVPPRAVFSRNLAQFAGTLTFTPSWTVTRTATRTATRSANSSPTPAEQGWTFCVNANQFCSFAGSKIVRFGARGAYVSGTYTNGVACKVSIFGDPIVGVPKHCDTKQETTPGTLTATATATRTPTNTSPNPNTATPTPTRTRTPALSLTRTATSTPIPPAGCGLNNLPAPTTPPAVLPPDHPIAVRSVNGIGEFYNRTTGQRFVPRGFDYLRLATQVGCYNPALFYHSTFNVGAYDANRVELAFEQMSAEGYNTIRVFINSCCANGVGSATGGLSSAYMDNLADMLRRAKSNGLQVVLTTDSVPELGGYVALASVNATSQIQGNNRFYLAPNWIAAQKRFWQDLVLALRQRNAPLDAILTYEIQNEAWFDGTLPPFSLTGGAIIPANGQTYDLSSQNDKIRMANDGIVYWVSELRRAILQVDPTALISFGIFPTGVPNASGFAQRYMPPGVVMANVSDGGAPVDWVDLHLYPEKSTMPAIAKYMFFDVPLQKPLVIGEFGISKQFYRTAAYAADGGQFWETQGCPFNITGWLLWSYDTTEQGGYWTALESNNLLGAALAPGERPNPCEPWAAVGVNVALNASVAVSQGASTAQNAVDGAPMSVWTSNSSAPQWIEINLGTPRRVNQIRLVTDQKTSGPALHRVWRITPGAPAELLFEYNGTTSNGQVIDYTPPSPWENVQIIRVETVTNPSPVAWREIELLSR